MSFFRSPIIVLGLCLSVLIAGLAMIGDQGMYRAFRLKREIQKIEARNLSWLQTNRELQEKVVRVKRDPGRAEQLARENLDLVRPDEVVFRFAHN